MTRHSPISPFQSSHTTSAPTVDRDSDAQQVIKHLNNSATADIDSIAIRVVNRLEGGLSRGQQDRNTSGQEVSNQERDYDFEFESEYVETDSDSQLDLSLDNNKIDTEESLDDTVQLSSSSAKAFLEKTWSHLCDCKEENTESAGELVLSIKEIAEY